MSKPLDAEHITNENVSEEVQENVLLEEEVKRVPAEETVAEATVEPSVDLEEETANVAETPKVAEIAETPEDEAIPEITAEEAVSEETQEETSEISEDAATIELPEDLDSLDKNGIVEHLAVLIQEPVSEDIKNKVDALKQVFYKLKRTELDVAKQTFVQEGGAEEDFVPEIDVTEERLKDLLTVFREKRASLTAEEDKIREDNLAAKKGIIEKLKTLIESNDDFYKIHNEFRALQQQWKEIKQIPQAAVNELWKDYQHYTEKFYDLLKINNEMRDYDFKKNLEMKQSLCESVERLESETDIISAFYQLQKLHQEWREIGPVAKDLREGIWSRFKKASSVINKKHQEHFESLRAMEQRNFEEKTALCDEVEAIDFSTLNSFKAWDAKSKQVLEIQEKWKTIGFAPKKHNVKIFERFRAACDAFFTKKSEYYKDVKGSMEGNLEKKKALCEKAEALKESQDWRETADKLIALQKEWRSIGPVTRKHSDAIWKRFIGACDYFFSQKNSHQSSQKNEETDNLKKKKDVIARINNLDEALPRNEAITRIRELMQEYNAIGYVPYRDKDKIYKEFRAAVDKHFDRLKMDESERRLQSFKSNLSEIAGGDNKSKNKLLNERDKLMRTYERLKSDIQTYENNIGFLSVSSKGGGGLLKDMNRKIETLKEELDLIVKKIEVIDENLEGGK